MTGRSTWRSLQSVMIVTLHVAAVAYVIRLFTRPDTLLDSFVWVPVAIALAVFISWPMARAIGSAFDPGEAPMDRTCPRCGRREIRPLIRPGMGIFQPASGFRCAACWTTFRQVEGSEVEELARSATGPVDPSGIEFVSETLVEGEIRFLDEGSETAA